MNRYKLFKDIKTPIYQTEKQPIVEHFQLNTNTIPDKHVFNHNFNNNFNHNFNNFNNNNFNSLKLPIKPEIKPEIKEKLTFYKQTSGNYNTSSPPVFGPPLWFSLHYAAAHFPDNPAPIARDRMKNIIISLPILIPCKNCQEHATAYIESNYDNLDTICSRRDSVFKFFVDFHNNVNERLGKPTMGYDDAYKLYIGGVNLSPISYS